MELTVICSLEWKGTPDFQGESAGRSEGDSRELNQAIFGPASLMASLA